MAIELTPPVVRSRQEAIALGLKRYFPSEPCPQGHTAEYDVKSGCMQCSRERASRWQRDNPTKTAERNRRYDKRHPEKQKARWGRYRSRNLEKRRAAYRRWRADNPEVARTATQRWYQENLQEAQARKRRWGKENPEGARAAVRRRRARKHALEGSHTSDEITALLDAQGGICAAPDCPADIRTGYSVDHKTPVTRGGSDDINNIQLMCKSCNSSKYDRTMEEWLATPRFRTVAM